MAEEVVQTDEIGPEYYTSMARLLEILPIRNLLNTILAKKIRKCLNSVEMNNCYNEPALAELRNVPKNVAANIPVTVTRNMLSMPTWII